MFRRSYVIFIFFASSSFSYLLRKHFLAPSDFYSFRYFDATLCLWHQNIFARKKEGVVYGWGWKFSLRSYGVLYFHFLWPSICIVYFHSLVSSMWCDACLDLFSFVLHILVYLCWLFADRFQVSGFLKTRNLQFFFMYLFDAYSTYSLSTYI